ncbi:ABC transporter ATP-binding protein, partial [Streptomyces sp. DSM 40712]|nr:ABC transporter ATP-binding protein [Streptomyces sp. DSM 40712]
APPPGRMALVLNAPPVTAPGPERPAPGGDLEVDGVRHGTLQGLKFQVTAGEFVAIAPYQPRAAADLAAVLAVNVPPPAYGGEVRLGGRPLADLSVEAVREHLLVNPYDAEIFGGTLRTNIDPSGTSRSVPEAVEASMLTDVVALH